MHFSLPGFRGFLYREWPEIIFDVPHRIEKKHSLPVYLLVKDAHKFSAELESFEIITGDGKSVFLKELNIPLNDKWFWQKFDIPLADIFEEEFTFFIRFMVRFPEGRKEFINDSLPLKKKHPFKVKMGNKRPTLPGFAWGDLHMHSNFTEDQIEFGAPIDYLQDSCKELGLDFICLTDHSYDLDQEFYDFRKQRLNPGKFDEFLQQIRRNRRKPVLIPGIEVSVGNQKGYNVHLLLLNPQKMHEGHGDSGRKWFNHKPTQMLAEFLAEQIAPEEIAIAAHPLQSVKKSHQILLKRDRWHEDDLIQDGITGYQILNGAQGEEFIEGKTLWIKHLLEGRKKFIYAGSDAHGNLNLYRQIDIPFIKLRYDYSHQPGRWVTGVFTTKEKPSRNSILDGIRNGRCIVSNGPLIRIGIRSGDRVIFPGETLITDQVNQEITMELQAISTGEFGALTNLVLYGGNCHSGYETSLKVITFEDKQYEFRQIFEINSLLQNNALCYIRAELTTQNNGVAISNPIWLER